MAIDIQKLFFLGRPFGPIYGLGMFVRQVFYQKNIFHRVKLPIPVISVGNLVLGGTGKTPVVAHIASMLKSSGYKPAIISRGYRGKASQTVNVVSDRYRRLLSVEDAGDEPSMLAEKLKGIPILTGKRRVLVAQHAIKTFDIDVIILDDGFQHLSLQRDLDIVLFDSTKLAGNSRIFPGGVLREPVSALHRASCFLLTGGTDENEKRATLFSELLSSRFADKPVFRGNNIGISLYDAPKRTKHVPRDCYFGFCGIANPSRFSKTLSENGVTLSGFKPLPDHVHYTDTMVKKLCEAAKASGASALITTAKDAVKLSSHKFDLPLVIADLKISISDGFDAFIYGSLNSFKR